MIGLILFLAMKYYYVAVVLQTKQVTLSFRSR